MGPRLRGGFFLSCRRRHTRYIGDWSSDVCSSDLVVRDPARGEVIGVVDVSGLSRTFHRSEERRVGKESRSPSPLRHQRINDFSVSNNHFSTESWHWTTVQ